MELGSGSSEKTRLLLDALRDAGTLRSYVPVDVSESALMAAGDALAAEYPGLAVHAVVSDFEEYLGLPSPNGDGRGRGSSRSSAPRSATWCPRSGPRSCRRVRSQLRPGDAFLLGTDLVKDPAVLVAAYDDSAGVTAAFNKNVLAVLNAELGADFDLDAFEHVAVWDAEREWIEMRLRSTADQHGAGAGPRAHRGVRRRRGDAHRGVGQVPPGGRRGRAGRGRASRCAPGGPTSAGQFGLSLSIPA